MMAMEGNPHLIDAPTLATSRKILMSMPKHHVKKSKTNDSQVNPCYVGNANNIRYPQVEANPFLLSYGKINARGIINPSLVYDLSFEAHYAFLFNVHYDETLIGTTMNGDYQVHMF